MYFHAPTLQIRGELLQVLSNPRGYLYGWQDDFANMIIQAADRRKANYLHEMGGNGSRDSWDDITYFITRDGNALLAVRRDGTVLANETARAGDKRYAETIRRLEPILLQLVQTKPHHWLVSSEELGRRF
jgi:hypothetical protein